MRPHGDQPRLRGGIVADTFGPSHPDTSGSRCFREYRASRHGDDASQWRGTRLIDPQSPRVDGSRSFRPEGSCLDCDATRLSVRDPVPAVAGPFRSCFVPIEMIRRPRRTARVDQAAMRSISGGFIPMVSAMTDLIERPVRAASLFLASLTVTDEEDSGNSSRKHCATMGFGWLAR